MEVVAGLVQSIVNPLIEVITRHVRYMVSSTNNLDEIRTNMVVLNAMASDMKTKQMINGANNLVEPATLPVWLEEVEKISAKVGNFPTGEIGCFNMKARYKAGKRLYEILEDIEKLKNKYSEIKWSGEKRPLGMVHTKKSSTSEPDVNNIDIQNVIKSSRDLMFDKALKALEPNNECQLMALCGMGGVGKSTMMEQLKKVAKDDKKWFDWVVKVVIGESKDKIMIQDAVAEYIGEPLTEKYKESRAERLSEKFKSLSEDGKKRILVILDDLWKKVDLEDIGLTTPLPKGFKLLITARDERVCTQMGVKPCCIFRIVVLEGLEAKKLFWKITGIVPDSEHDLIKIGEEIVKKCDGLPIAIATIASTLRDNKDKETWRDALDRFQDESSRFLNNIFEISYNHLKEEDEKATFLLSGLFPDDHNIRIEDLTRYGFGLKLFKNLNVISKARRRVKACVGNLIRSNLLIESDSKEYVKIHDLVRDFVLSNFANVKQTSLVNNDNISDQLRKDSYERLLIKCGGMLELLADFNHPNLALLSLMDGKELTQFPQDFYKRMKKLEVVAYTGINVPLLPRQLTTLRTLCLDSCKSLGDISFLGDLINLEVLSFAFCGISNLPSAIGKLKNLKLLDLTESAADLCIGDGVFQSLNKLEELYMRAKYGKPIRFTEDSCEGLKIISSKLTALEVEFFKSNLQPKNVSFKNLERFRISIGAQLGPFTSENTLQLVASKEEILECKINELFEKTEELNLSANGMSSVQDILKHPSEYSFWSLKVLRVYNCVDLTFIFTVNVVSSLTKLERLTVSKCPLLESLVQGEKSEASKVIKFIQLKSLELDDLPEFDRLCDGDQVMDFPQLLNLSLDSLPNVTSIFSKNNEKALTMKVLTPKLKMLTICEMEKLKEIWCDTTTGLEEVYNISMLKEIEVRSCKSLVNLFPRNPMRLLTHLQTLVVDECCSIEVLFNIDLQQGCVGKITENVSGSSSSSSSLRSIQIVALKNLREVWRIKGGSNSDIIIRDFKGVQSLVIGHCGKLRSIFTPTTVYFDMGALENINVVVCGERSELLTDGQKQEIIPEVAIPSSLLHTFHQLPNIALEDYRVEVVFDMKSTQSSSRDLVTTTYNPNQLRPCKIYLEDMEQMTHVWRCNWNEYFVHQNQHPQSLFCNITTIKLDNCKSIKYLFSPLMAALLSNLKKLEIGSCKSMEEVVSSRDDDKDDNENEMMTPSTTLFPHLDLVIFNNLPNLKHVGGGIAKVTTNLIPDHLKVPQVGVVRWSLCQYSQEIHIYKCDALSSVIPSYTSGQRLKVEVLVIQDCNSLSEVFSSAVEENHNGCHSSTISYQGSGATDTSGSIPRLGNISAHKLSNLKKMHIIKCDSLEYIFTFSTLESLKKLKEIRIRYCKAMKVIVREEEEEGTQTPTPNKVVVVIPHLEVIELVSLSNLEGFFLGIKEFEWPLLNDVYIERCPKMTAFTCSKSIAPRLNYVEHPIFKKFSPQHYNFYTKAALPQITYPSLEGTSSCPAISNDEAPPSLHDIKELNVDNGRSQVIVAFNELLQLQNLEKIQAKRCKQAMNIFEVELEVTDSEFNAESETSVVKLPKLRQVVLEELDILNYLWKNNKWRQLELPNLTRLSIHNCDSLEHVFTTSMVGSLMHLQELHVTHCDHMREIVKVDDNCERKVLPCLKSLKLDYLKCFLGFCLHEKNFLLPSLSTLVMKKCPFLSVFNNKIFVAPELKVIETNEGLINLGGQDINSFMITNTQKRHHFGIYLDQ